MGSLFHLLAFFFFSLFFFSTLEGSFLKSFRDTEPKTMPIKRRREGNRQVCVCWGGWGAVHAFDGDHEPSLRWWLDSLACLKACHA